MSILAVIFGDANARYVKSMQGVVREINSLEKEFEKFSEDDLAGMTTQLKSRFAHGETLDDLLVDAYAAVREAAKRTLGQRHFDVQLVGGIALHQGKIAEMKTGEGKTLVATLPLYLNCLAGKGAHLVTPNDYLSRIGAGWMGPVYHALGVSVGVITHDTSGIFDPRYEDPEKHGDLRLSHFRFATRREAYEADITYGTNNEFGFDYLRDNLEYNPVELRQRGHFFAIVDEVDSILIDEARTPLIISMPDEESADLYRVFSRVTPQLKEGADYNVDEKLKAVAMTEEGIDKVERLIGVENIYEEKGVRFVRHLEQALRSHALFRRDRDYVVKDGEVIIVDEFTGRLMPGRRWSEGLHQAVEAKEGVTIQRESRTLATVTFQNYFRMYEKLGGMTGTAQTSAEEFHKVYGLEVITIPTHSPMVREDKGDLVFRTERGKFQAVVREVRELHAKGQPVLIGTVSIEKNERLSKMLQVEGISHELLNAKNHEREALIIAQAGSKGVVTVATNMAGRGVDIILGGNSPDLREAEDVRGRGGLHVIGTERHEARRIDNQLRGRSGRQGDPGSSQFFVSLEDDLMRIFGSDKIKRMMESFGIPEDQPIENRIVSRALEAAQAKIEGFHFDARKHVLEYDDVLNKQRDAIYRMRKEVLFAENQNVKVQISNQVQNQNVKTLKEKIFEMIEEEIGRLVEFHTSGDPDGWNTEEIFETMKTIVAVTDDIHAELRNVWRSDLQTSDLHTSEAKIEAGIEYLLGILQKQYDEREQHLGVEAMRHAERGVMLRSIDMLWMDHLDQMEHLRDSVRLRAYGQRDPLVEYKNEGVRLFRELQAAIRTQVVHTIFKVGGNVQGEVPRTISEGRGNVMNEGGEKKETIAPAAAGAATFPKGTEVKRNDPCHCGSGKKYKKCHGA